MITIKNSQLDDNTIIALNSLMDVEMDAIAAFKLTKIIKEISIILKDKNKIEQKLIEKHADKNENNEIIYQVDENGNKTKNVNISDMDAFNTEMSNFSNQENVIEYEKMRFEDIGMKTATIKSLMKLEFLFI
jgi:hypothetical protein